MDIYATKSLRDFVISLTEQLKPFGITAIETFVNCVRTLQAGLSLDVAGNPSFNVPSGDLRDTRTTLNEIFRYLDAADKLCIIAIDEFQQIALYCVTTEQVTYYIYDKFFALWLIRNFGYYYRWLYNKLFSYWKGDI